MQRIQTADNRFAAGNPQLGTPGTIVTAKFLNDVQEEIVNVILAAGIELNGTEDTQLLLALCKLINDKSIPYFSTIPTELITPVVYVLGKGELEWQTFGDWSGYASLWIGKPYHDSDPVTRSMTIELTGDTFLKSEYPALWAWAQARGKVVASESWKSKTDHFVDLGTMFRAPDLQNVFFRSTGIDLDNANARVLGSYQADSFRSHKHNLKTAEVPGNGYYAFIDFGQPGTGVGQYSSINPNVAPGGVLDTYTEGGSETRGQNTALAPRIIAF